MPTILTHPAAAIAFRGLRKVPRHVFLLGALATVLPDADVTAFAYGIPYASTFGHRGFTHSIVFALLSASLLTAASRSRTFATFAFLFACAMSHPLLDALTDGGLGIAFFSPFSNHRYFFPWRPIRVSPIGIDIFDARGLQTLKSEGRWVWVPAIVVAIVGVGVRRVRERASSSGG